MTRIGTLFEVGLILLSTYYAHIEKFPNAIWVLGMLGVGVLFDIRENTRYNTDENE